MRSDLSKTHYALAIIFVFMVAAATPLAANAQFINPKVSGKEITIRNVVILPAKVDIVRSGMKGPEGMAAESEELSARVEKVVADVLANQKKIRTITDSPTSTENGDGQGKYAITDVQTKFDDLMPKIMKKRSDVKKARFTMGDEVLNLNLDKATDAIVFIRGSGQKLTSGKSAFNILVGGMPAYLRLYITMVDARTGEVLLYTDPVFGGDPTTAVDRLRKALEKGFKKLPVIQM